MTNSTDIAATRHVVDVGPIVPELAGQPIAATVFSPADPSGQIVFCCLPGGGLSRRYWDLQVPEDDSYSFARWMASRGFPVISVDHAGTGGSTLSRDGTPPLLGHVIAANHAVFSILCNKLQQQWTGTATAPALRRVGVGHSMGAGLTVRQQAVHETYDAICLVGFDTKGLPGVIPPEVTDLLTDEPPDDVLLAQLTVRMFGSAYPAMSANVHGTRTVPAPVRLAMEAATTRLLGAGGLLSLLPGNVAIDAGRIRVPALVLNGEHDSLINGRLDRVTRYPGTASFTSHVLPGAGHIHNIAPTRNLFWENMLHWTRNAFPQ
ncbi:MAG: alpha/beta hydrolase [Nocardia sp.]|uniref:alpha/beta hydrolase n=1 Tax=Nocardia sp. TaxID=1821 RepID=UPI00263399C9|nr:alpha/beta fold hydrolase [Nocardia sp.]MCU1646131.1 alpha/beta hydrolase [Nocardia sp.]